jgi:hypothetical protein
VLEKELAGLGDLQNERTIVIRYAAHDYVKQSGQNQPATRQFESEQKIPTDLPNLISFTNQKLRNGNHKRNFNPLKTKRRLLYLKTQFVPRSKHFSSGL